MKAQLRTEGGRRVDDLPWEGDVDDAVYVIAVMAGDGSVRTFIYDGTQHSSDDDPVLIYREARSVVVKV